MTAERAAEAILSGLDEDLVGPADLLGLDPQRLEDLYDAGLTLFHRGAKAQAEDIFGWLVKASPYTAKYWTAFGTTLQRRQAWLDAVQVFTVALAIDDDDTIARAYRGEGLLMLGLTDAGIQDLRQAAGSAELNPWTRRARWVLELYEEASQLD